MIKIWGRRNSINVQKVMWIVQELGIAHERVDAGMQYGIVDESWYRAMNPNGRVPTIDDAGFVLWESNAIVRYLVSRYGEGKFLPRTTQVQALADSWMDWTSSTLAAPVTALFWGLIRTPENERNYPALDAHRVQVEKVMAILDAHLHARQYIAGNEISMGDVPAGCFVHRWYAMPIERGPYPQVAAWYARLCDRVAFREQVMLPLS